MRTAPQDRQPDYTFRNASATEWAFICTMDSTSVDPKQLTFRCELPPKAERTYRKSPQLTYCLTNETYNLEPGASIYLPSLPAGRLTCHSDCLFTFVGAQAGVTMESV